MKSENKKYRIKKSKPMELRESAVAEWGVSSSDTGTMVRTQIYLDRKEHQYILTEASRLGMPMAAVIRSFIDEKMEVPEDAWDDNPLLKPPVKDPTFKGCKDGAVNHDHYIYGTPKKWMRRGGKWVETPPVPEDYYRNPETRRKYDEEVDQWT